MNGIHKYDLINWKLHSSHDVTWVVNETGRVKFQLKFHANFCNFHLINSYLLGKFVTCWREKFLTEVHTVSTWTQQILMLSLVANFKYFIFVILKSIYVLLNSTMAHDNRSIENMDEYLWVGSTKVSNQKHVGIENYLEPL